MPGGVLIHEDFHPSETSHLNGSYLLLGKIGGVIQACHNVFPGKRGVLGEKVVNSIAASEHVDDLMDRNSRALYASLTMADIRIDRDSI